MNEIDRLAHPLYQDALSVCRDSGANWSNLDGATVAISGASGLIGTFLVDCLMSLTAAECDVRVLALGRSEGKARSRLPYFGRDRFAFEELDVSVPGVRPRHGADVVIHLASVTHPRGYAIRPVGTIASNVLGLSNLLEYTAANHLNEDRNSFCFASSVEIYGENRGDVDRFSEDYCGYLDCNTLRAGYPEAKRLGEALCQAYAAERGVHSSIVRLPRTLGPTLLPDDSKAASQFLKNALAGDDIVLKSAGSQLYSYLYVADTVSGMLFALTRGGTDEAYNLADSSCDVSLRDLAQKIAHFVEREVIFDLPDDIERSGYSTATKALLDASKLNALGWRAHYTLDEAIHDTIRIAQSL